MKRKVYYVLTQIDRIGQLADEMFFLCNLYHPDKYDITVITHDPDCTPTVNRELYRILMRGMEVGYTNNEKLVYGKHDSRLGSIYETENKIYVYLSAQDLKDLFLKKQRYSRISFLA